MRVVLITLDSHLAAAAARAAEEFSAEVPGFSFRFHAASGWNPGTHGEPCARLRTCHEDIAAADIVIVTMLFMEDHVQAVFEALEARRDHCDAMVAVLSDARISRLTRMGALDMSAPDGPAMAALKKLRAAMSKESKGASTGEKQMAMLRRLPKLLRFVPGKAQDLRAYFLVLQYWLAGSQVNILNLLRYLVSRYADGPRRDLVRTVSADAPEEYPEVGLYHPRLRGRVSVDATAVPQANGAEAPRVGVLVMRSQVLARDTEHYDAVIDALEAAGLNAVPVFSSGLDARPAIERYLKSDGAGGGVEALVSLTGFSLVGGPAYNDSDAAAAVLGDLDVPYLAAHAVEFQSLKSWSDSTHGLMPIEATMMVALPELDGATSPMVFGGRAEQGTGRMRSADDRAERLAERVRRLVALRRAERAERQVAVVLFNFPPNGGAVGTAASLAVFESLHSTLVRLAGEGYTVEVPESVDALRVAILEGNAAEYGTVANVHQTIACDDHVRRETWLAEIEQAWGPAPGSDLSDGSRLFVLGRQFGNVLVTVQPPFGYEGDPMRLLFDGTFAPTHAFSAFYRYLREDFGAHALLHFGTHGALEFMPGKQCGLSGECWPERLLGAVPNVYLYAANNPSEGTIAKRRSAATLVSYLTPMLAESGLYQGLADLKALTDRIRSLPADEHTERASLAEAVQASAAALELTEAEPPWPAEDVEARVAKVVADLHEVENTLIPHGLHVVGGAVGREERIDTLNAMAQAMDGEPIARDTVVALVDGTLDAGDDERLGRLAGVLRSLGDSAELDGLVAALDGRFIEPAPGGDLLRNPDVLPTGRNLHGFDPFKMPSAFALSEGAQHAEQLLERHGDDGNEVPRSIAMVLWGTDNLKSEGVPIGQAMALYGARPRFDGYGRLCGAELIPLEELGRPRVDVVLTLSGIFRDLLPLQTRMLAEAAWLAASADEPLEMNPVRAHALEYQAEHDCDLETAALRVFSNAAGAYGANVNHLIDSGCWEDEDELAEAYSQRKCFAYGLDGKPARRHELLQSVLGHVDFAYQNLESAELGVTTIDHYFDSLGGIKRAVRRVRGDDVPVYIADQTQGVAVVRSLGEQVALEARTRLLNPKWYEAMLEHGYEGVRHIEAGISNALGWSATTEQVDEWVYEELSATYVLNEQMRDRMAALNPGASARVANRLLEAQARNYWSPAEDTLNAMVEAGEYLEDLLEGVECIDRAPGGAAAQELSA